MDTDEQLHHFLAANYRLPSPAFAAVRLARWRRSGRYPFGSVSTRLGRGTVVLTANEIALCRMLGPQRNRGGRRDGRANMIQAGSDREYFAEINGVCGELAFAKLFDLFPHGPLEIKSRSVHDDDGDFTYRGRCVDVKTTEHRRGRLVLADWKVREPAAYLGKVQALALVVGDYRASGEFRFCGFIDARTLLDRTPRSLPGKSCRNYTAEQHELGGWPFAD